MNSRTENTKLISQAINGDQQSFKRLYQLHKQSLFLVCLRYAKDRSVAQDYLQEAFISIYKNLSHFDDTRGAFGAWAKRIAINVCLMDIRKNPLYSVGMDDIDQVDPNANEALSNLSLQELMRMIQQLPQGYKTVFNMYVIDGFSHKEIAAELNISINTSKTQLMKARKLLQKKIMISQKFDYSNSMLTRID